MHRRVTLRCPGQVVALFLLLSAHSAHAQTRKYSCPYFFKDIHQTMDCVEAYFSQDPAHFTFSSVPPGNGMALGGVLENTVHYVSPFAPRFDPDLRSNAFQSSPPYENGYKSVVHEYVAASGSSNGSWVTTGGVDMLPPLHYTHGKRDVGPVRPNGSRATEDCHKLGKICTKQVFGLSLDATHRSIQTVAFYGLGPRSPATKYTFHLNETYGGLSARMPLLSWFTVQGELEDLQPDLPLLSTPLAVNRNFTTATAPGIDAQPNFLRSKVGIITFARHIVEPGTNPNPNATEGPLLKKLLVLSFANNGAFQPYTDVNGGRYSFHQILLDGHETFQFGAVIQKNVLGNARQAFPFPKRAFYGFIAHSCGATGGDLRATYPCDFGKLDIVSHMTLSNTGSGQVIPFYLQPTVGGSDIDSRLSLRGFPDYRFRDRNIFFLQAEYAYPLIGPLSALTFYDAGQAAGNISGLSIAHLRQDGGFGANVKFGNSTAAQLYLALGAGHGPHLGFNLAKLF